MDVDGDEGARMMDIKSKYGFVDDDEDSELASQKNDCDD